MSAHEDKAAAAHLDDRIRPTLRVDRLVLTEEYARLVRINTKLRRALEYVREGIEKDMLKTFGVFDKYDLARVDEAIKAGAEQSPTQNPPTGA
jgi:hypothetical protein